MEEEHLACGDVSNVEDRQLCQCGSLGKEERVSEWQETLTAEAEEKVMETKRQEGNGKEMSVMEWTRGGNGSGEKIEGRKEGKEGKRGGKEV